MPRGRPLPNRDEVVAAMDGTRTAPEIAEQFGMMKSSVYSIYIHEHDRGRPVKLKAMRPKYRTRTAAAKRITIKGHLAALITSLPDEVCAWFCAQIPAGGDANDLLRGFIVDAYHDEVSQ